jgi:sporulation protein YlmC with PRC-barrel domain
MVMPTTAKGLGGLLATTAMLAFAGGLAVAQEQQQGDAVTTTVPVEQPAAQEQPAGEAAEGQAATGEEPAQPQVAEEPATDEPAQPQVTEEQPPAEEGVQEELAEEPAAGEDAEEQVATDAPRPPEGPFIDVQDEGTLLAGDLQGLSVIGAEGDSIGTIDDLILHPEGGIFGAVVSVGGFLGIGAKEVALSWNEFQYAPEEQVARVNFTREDLEQAPDFKTLADIEAEQMAMQQQQMPDQGAVPAPGAMPEPAAGGSQ